MLVAEKNYYYGYEEYASVIPKIKEPKIQQKSSKKPKNRAAAKLFKFVFRAAVCFAIAFVILIRYAAITEITNKIDEQKKELINLEKTNSQMRAEISVDLKKVDEVSKNKLGMDRPYKYQIVYVELKNNDFDNSYNEKEKFSIAQKIEKFVQYLY